MYRCMKRGEAFVSRACLVEISALPEVFGALHARKPLRPIWGGRRAWGIGFELQEASHVERCSTC